MKATFLSIFGALDALVLFRNHMRTIFVLSLILSLVHTYIKFH